MKNSDKSKGKTTGQSANKSQTSGTGRDRAEKKYSTIIETALDGFWITDLKGRFLDVNDSYCRMTGYDREELLTMSIPDIEALEKPEETAQHIKKVMEQGYDRFETRHRRKDGKMIDLEISANYSDLEGGQLVVFIRDITERKRVETELKRIRRQNELILNSAGEGILGLDGEGKHVFANPSAARMLGYEIEELIGKRSHPTWHHSEASGRPYSQEKCPICASFKAGRVHSIYDEVFWRKDGTSFPVAYVSAPIIEDGKLAGAVVVFNDVTERKQAELTLAKQLEILQRQAQEILEISTPVLQIWKGVVIAPLIGTLDSQRTQKFMERLLARIVETNSPVALIDITGVPTIDTQTAQHLIDTISAVRLLGAQVILTGVRPATAQTLVHLGVDMSGVTTRSSLAAGLIVAMNSLGLEVSAGKKAGTKEE